MKVFDPDAHFDDAAEITTARWTSCLATAAPAPDKRSVLLGVLPGEGVGPEVIGAALDVLTGVADAAGLQVEVRTGGPIGRMAEPLYGAALSEEVTGFCADIFARGGAILNGPGGGRYVYDLRKRFDLFFKISPLCHAHALPAASRIKAKALRRLNILIARENSGGIYQGEWNEQQRSGERVAEHRTEYSEKQVRRFLHAAARLARGRNGRLTVVWKEAGVPTISKLWRDCAADAADTCGVAFAMIDIDLMGYRLIQDAAAFDVVAAPNLCGDVLADLGAVLLGSRGLSFSGNWSERGEGVYQTNHGAAYDLAGSDRANPVGQIFSLAMLLRESFGLSREANAIEEAVRRAWRDGFQTEDVALTGSRVVGTREMGRHIADYAGQILRENAVPEGRVA